MSVDTDYVYHIVKSSSHMQEYMYVSHIIICDWYYVPFLEANSSMLSPDDKETLPPRHSVPALLETSFDEDDYPTEVCIQVHRIYTKVALFCH